MVAAHLGRKVALCSHRNMQESKDVPAGSFVAVPVLETPRLVLSGHGPQDFDEYAALWSDEDVVRYITGRVLTREESWSRFLRAVGHWSVRGYGYWVVRERATGRMVGDAGLADLQREMEPSHRGEPEAGWVLSPWARGRGYATEAVQAVLRWTDATLAVPRVVCLIDPDNAPSLRVAQRCGFATITRTQYAGSEVEVFERRRQMPTGI